MNMKTITKPHTTFTREHSSGDFLRNPKVVQIGLLTIAGLAIGCSSESDSTVDGGDTGTVDRPAGWGEATHSSDAEPDYDLLFDDEVIAEMEVHRIDLEISQDVYDLSSSAAFSASVEELQNHVDTRTQLVNSALQ